MKELHTIFNRKAKRKEQRKIKKQKKEIYYKKLDNKVISPLPTPQQITEKLKKKPKPKKKKEKNEKNENPNKSLDFDDDKLIRIYEKKLGITKKKQNEMKYQNQMFRDGLDRNFFNLLDRIHTYTQNPLDEYKKPDDKEDDEFLEDEEEVNEDDLNESEEIDNEEDNYIKDKINNKEEDDDNDNDDDFIENEESLEEEEINSSLEEENNQNLNDEEEKDNISSSNSSVVFQVKRPNSQNKQKSILKQAVKIDSKAVYENKEVSNPQLLEKKTEIIKKEINEDLVKKIQSNMNKLSEGNIDNIFSQMVNIFLDIIIIN